MRNAIYLVALAILASCNNNDQVTKPTFAPISESVYASGTLKSKNQYEVFSSVSGIIDSIYVSEGDPVVQGDLIMVITGDAQRLSKENAELSAVFADIRANQGKLQDAKNSVKLSRERMANDSLMYFRQKNLWQQNIGSKVVLEQSQLAYETSKTSYLSTVVRYKDLKRQLEFNDAQSRKNLKISSSMADDYLIKTKTSGTVYSLNREKGEIVSPQLPLAVIGSSSEFILEMQVDEYDIFKVRKGMRVMVSLDSYKDTVFEAKVTKINPLMDERSRTFVVEATFLRQPERLYPNISFEANIILASKPSAMLVPRNYVVSDTIVYTSDGKSISVKTGLKDYRMIEIRSGLAKDDELMLPPQ